MFAEIQHSLSEWGSFDTWIVITASLAAMACALPGVFLVLRQQSMMGDALSHTVLPGIVVAFLLSYGLRDAAWISPSTQLATLPLFLFGGAVVLGVVSAMLTEFIQRLGHVESSAALGVVFTSLFAFGLLMIRLKADSVHIDPDCVLYGNVETVKLGVAGIPRATAMVAGLLVVNLILVLLFYKELTISAFDPNLATTLGIRARLMHYALMATTAATLVAAFESVGSILVITMLVAPTATASLLTDRLPTRLVVTLAIAFTTALLGHAMALTLPALVFSRLGFPEIKDASTAGMMAVVAGMLFILAMFFAPRHGMISKALGQTRLTFRLACHDQLRSLYQAERAAALAATFEPATWATRQGSILQHLATWSLIFTHQVTRTSNGHQLTSRGRQSAEQIMKAGNEHAPA
ncbi:MAG: metal ABC transporter permease [Planctomycetota bacterium]|nr:metal ABC transporter permease [Planctomycetota bacterium]